LVKDPFVKNGDQLEKKRLLNKEKMMSFMEEVLQSMVLVRRVTEL
jgi:hypothetical protein